MSRLGALGIDFPYMVAPMVGVSHVAFRELVRQYTPRSVRPLFFTEMLSTRRLPSQRLNHCESLRIAPAEASLVPQLLGNEEGFIQDSIRRLLPAKPRGFDINMGCPVKRTLSHNWGVRLMGDRDYAAEVVRATKRHSPIPVSVKLRAGFGDVIDLPCLLRFTEVERAGADWLTLHCRVKAQKHTGTSDWAVAGEIARERAIPVVTNGDIQTADDALKVTQELGTDGAMIGRAALARPWILGQIAKRLGKKVDDVSLPETSEDEGREYFRALVLYLDLLEHYFGDTRYAFEKLMIYVGISHRWLPFGHEFLRGIRRCNGLVQARGEVYRFSEMYPQPLYQRVFL